MELASDQRRRGVHLAHRQLCVTPGSIHKEDSSVVGQVGSNSLPQGVVSDIHSLAPCLHACQPLPATVAWVMLWVLVES